MEAVIKCPNCRSFNLIELGERNEYKEWYEAPYLCKDCNTRFIVRARSKPPIRTIGYSITYAKSIDELKAYATERCNKIFSSLEAKYYVDDCLDYIDDSLICGYVPDKNDVDEWIAHECRVAKGHDD